MRLSEVLGRPIERGLRLLPEGAQEALHDLTRAALERALGAALMTLRTEGFGAVARERMHRYAGAAAGAAGGVFGLVGLAIELPITTVLIFRTIAEIARAEGHDLSEFGTRLACLEVFAFGGSRPEDDAAETAYYAVRATLAKALSDAARHLAGQGMARQGAPVLVRFVDAIAARFGVVVEEKMALESVPLIGAVSGAVVNTVFIEHFQRIARGHFILLRLERRHGGDLIEKLYAAES